MKEYTKQHKKAWEFNAYNFWTRTAGTPTERARKDMENPERMLKQCAGYFDRDKGDRIANICDHMRKRPERYGNFNFFPCMPYAHKYANAVTELGILGAAQRFIPGNIFSVTGKAGIAFLKKDYPA